MQRHDRVFNLRRCIGGAIHDSNSYNKTLLAIIGHQHGLSFLVEERELGVAIPRSSGGDNVICGRGSAEDAGVCWIRSELVGDRRSGVRNFEEFQDVSSLDANLQGHVGSTSGLLRVEAKD
jgi:hypothetical protein